jgi:hypothetical protein
MVLGLLGAPSTGRPSAAGSVDSYAVSSRFLAKDAKKAKNAKKA